MIHLCSFDEEILHVYGSLIPEHTGSINWLDRNLEADSQIDRFFSYNISVEIKEYFWQYIHSCLAVLKILQKWKEEKKWGRSNSARARCCGWGSVQLSKKQKFEEAKTPGRLVNIALESCSEVHFIFTGNFSIFNRWLYKVPRSFRIDDVLYDDFVSAFKILSMLFFVTFLLTCMSEIAIPLLP